MKYEIGQIGRILTGDNIGHWIKVEDDTANTGGYLIHISPSEDFSHGGDDWVSDLESLEKYIRESNWSIRWL